MSYIGKTPLVGNYQICDALTASATADYTLQVGSANVSPQSANAMIVSLNGVIQGPGASRGFTVSGSTISFNSALTSSDVIDFIYIFGDVLDIGTPTDDSVSAAKLTADAVTTAKILDSNVTTAKIADNNVTLAKLDDGTQGDVLYYGASGAPARLGFGTSGDFLKTQGTGANPVWATPGGGKTVFRTYYEYATRTIGSGSIGAIFNYTTGYIPVDPTVNDIQVQQVAPCEIDVGNAVYFGMRFAKSGGSDYDFLNKGIYYIDPNGFQGNFACSFNIAAGTIAAGTYTVSLWAASAGSATTYAYWCPNTTDDALYGAQTSATLMLTEWKN